MGTLGRTACRLGAAVTTAVVGWYPAGATVDPEPGGRRGAATWGACGSWWSETPGRVESGSICGVDGLVTENGRATQLAEPLISVSRYVCTRPRARERGHEPVDCTSETFTGSVRRSEMTVDPLLRRASIRGSLGGCTLDVEFAGFGPVQPNGHLAGYHGLAPGSPSLSVSGGQTFTSQASWWGGVCGQTVVPPPGGDGGGAWIFRGVETSLSGGGGGDGHGHGHGEG